MLRQTLLASAGTIALASAAFAADLPSRAPPPVYIPPTPIFSWTGFYVGGQVGYGWGTQKANVSLPNGNTIYNSYSAEGVIGGGHVGYNYQANQWVIGLEGSVDGTSLSKTLDSGDQWLLLPGGRSQLHHELADSGVDPRPARHRLGPCPDLCHWWRGIRRLQRVLLDPDRLHQPFVDTGWLDGRRRCPICRHQQLVDLCRISLLRFRLLHQLPGVLRSPDCGQPALHSEPGPGRVQLQVRHLCSGAGRRQVLMSSRLTDTCSFLRQNRTRPSWPGFSLRKIGLFGCETGRDHCESGTEPKYTSPDR